MRTQTWVIIVKFKIPKDVKKPITPFPLGPFKRRPEKLKITGTTTVRLDKPLLIIPNGEAESVEIIPITEPAVLHSRNLRRRIK